MTIQECREKIWSIPPSRQELNNLVSSYLFSPANQEKDFGTIIPYVDYFVRINEAHNKYTPYFEYLSLIFYADEYKENKFEKGEFVEAIYEHYLAPKNTKKKGKLNMAELQKGGFAAFSSKIFRTIDELKDFLAIAR